MLNNKAKPFQSRFFLLQGDWIGRQDSLLNARRQSGISSSRQNVDGVWNGENA